MKHAWEREKERERETGKTLIEMGIKSYVGGNKRERERTRERERFPVYPRAVKNSSFSRSVFRGTSARFVRFVRSQKVPFCLFQRLQRDKKRVVNGHVLLRRPWSWPKCDPCDFSFVTFYFYYRVVFRIRLVADTEIRGEKVTQVVYQIFPLFFFFLRSNRT